MFLHHIGTVLLLASTAAPPADDGIDSPMATDPAVPMPRVVATFPDGSLDLWLAALARPEVDLRTRAAATIGAARDRGMIGLEPAVGPLTAALDRPDQHPAVRLAAARALVALDAKGAAASLWRYAADGGPELREVAEPAMARWGYDPARAVWLDRLARPPYHRGTVFAMRGLAAARDGRAAPALREIALSPVAGAAFRVEAARALGAIRPAGLEADAERLLAEGSVPARLAAASLLAQHKGPEAVRLLQRLAADREPAVAFVAAGRLRELGPELLLPVLGTLLESPGADIRAIAVEALGREPTPVRLKLLADRLTDPHPDVRVSARRGLRAAAARPEFREAVVGHGAAALGGSDWRGQEQAAILLARLGHKGAAPRLVELLDAPKGEVFVAAAFGLRVLADPATLEAVTKHLGKRYASVMGGGVKGVHPSLVEREMVQLAQFLGQAGHRPGVDLLRKIVVRLLTPGAPPNISPVGTEARAAAVWALGRIYAGDPDEEVVEQIEERLTGDSGVGQDDPPVRAAAAVALARMKATGSLPALRTHALGTDPNADPAANACRWAVAQLTGAPLAPPGTAGVMQKDPFLLPAK